jgi:hypothetical protein
MKITFQFGFSFSITCLSLVACGERFEPASKIESVRILATRADKPYAAPGETVTLDMLAFDGRLSQTTHMKTYWVPTICTNPKDDTYYECYSSFGEQFKPGVDISPQLHEGDEFAFQMPDDIIDTHAVSSRGGAAYGLVVIFSVACAGHVEYVKNTTGGADVLPLGCFDSAHNRLGANDFVFAYSLVYSFAERSNANPVIDSVSFGGAAVDLDVGASTERCTLSDIEDCAAASLNVVVSDESQELDPGNLDIDGNTLKEQIWVDYYVTGGKVAHDALIHFEPHNGRVTDSSNDFYAPGAPGNYLLWAVAHDNRGGVNWVQVPVNVN